MNNQYFTKPTLSKLAILASLLALIAIGCYLFWQWIETQSVKQPESVELKTYTNEKYGFTLDYPSRINGKILQIVEGERETAGYFDVRIFYRDEMLDYNNEKVGFDNSLVSIITYQFDPAEEMSEQDVKSMLNNFSEQDKAQEPGTCSCAMEKNLAPNIKVFRSVIFYPLYSSCASPDVPNSIPYDIKYYIPDYERKQVIGISNSLLFIGSGGGICLNNNFTLKPVSEIQNKKECAEILAFENVISSFRFIKRK